MGTNPQISWRNQQVQIGGTDMNWDGKIFQDGQFHMAAWSRHMRFFTQASVSTPYDIYFSPWNGSSVSEAMRIVGEGNVGIGTNNPTSEINSNNQYFGPNIVGGRALTIGTTTTGQANLILQSNHQEGTGDVLGGLYFSHPSGQGDAHHIVGAIQSVVHPHSNRIFNGGDLAFLYKNLLVQEEIQVMLNYT